MVQNKRLIFKAVPYGKPVPGKDLAVEIGEFDLSQPAPAGGITTRNHCVSFDPYMRGRMRDSSVKSYNQAFTIGEPIASHGVVRVLKSANDKYEAGDIIVAFVPTEEYSSLAPAYLTQARKIQGPYKLDPMLSIGPLGMPGLTAYSSFYEIGKPKKGETILISAASGAVGQIVGQLAKHEGLKVFGSVGDDKKLDFIINELGFDGGFNYKKEKSMDAVARLAPGGLDIYYENVGGELLDTALLNMNDYGRLGKSWQLPATRRRCLTRNSDVWDDLAVQPQARRAVQGSEPVQNGHQEALHARLHRQRSRHGTKTLHGPPD